MPVPPDERFPDRPLARQGAEALSACGFVALPELVGSDQAWWARFYHPAGVLVASRWHSKGSAEPHWEDTRLWASLDLGLFHSRAWSPPGSHVFGHRPDGSVVLSVSVSVGKEGDLFAVLRDLQAQGRFRTFAQTAKDSREGYDSQGPSFTRMGAGVARPDTNHPANAAAFEKWRQEAPRELMDLLFGNNESQPEDRSSPAMVARRAGRALTLLRERARRSGRRYLPPNERLRLQAWVLGGVQACPDVDPEQVKGLGSQLDIWTDMMQEPGGNERVLRWIERAPLQTLAVAVAPVNGRGWGERLFTAVLDQTDDFPSIIDSAAAVERVVERLGHAAMAASWGADPWGPQWFDRLWSISAHHDLPASLLALLTAAERAGAPVPLPTGANGWADPAWERPFQNSGRLDWAPLHAWRRAQALDAELLAPVKFSTRRKRL